MIKIEFDCPICSEKNKQKILDIEIEYSGPENYFCE